MNENTEHKTQMMMPGCKQKVTKNIAKYKTHNDSHLVLFIFMAKPEMMWFLGKINTCVPKITN